MAISFAARTDVTEILRKEYQEKLSKMPLEEVVREFLSYLEYTEETDSGRVFRPICISSVRALMNEPLEMVLELLKEKVNVNSGGR